MTNSVMSSEDDKAFVTAIKTGKLHQDDENGGPMSIVKMVQNIDELSERAKNMKITKNDFIDCLREITKDKMVAVKEAKDMFEKRVKKLITAQEYILRSQEN